MSVKERDTISPPQNQENLGTNDKYANVIDKENIGPGYIKEVLTEQDVYTSGVVYRYINNVDPNKDLITDTAKYGGPLHIEIVKDN